MNEDDDFDWPPGWGALEPEQAADCTDQLRFELGPDDPLSAWFDHEAIWAVGGSVTSDHVVFEIDDWEAPYFVSLLSWLTPDERHPWLQKLFPRPRPDPGVVPISTLSELEGWAD